MYCTIVYLSPDMYTMTTKSIAISDMAKHASDLQSTLGAAAARLQDHNPRTYDFLDVEKALRVFRTLTNETVKLAEAASKDAKASVVLHVPLYDGYDLQLCGADPEDAERGEVFVARMNEQFSRLAMDCFSLALQGWPAHVSERPGECGSVLTILVVDITRSDVLDVTKPIRELCSYNYTRFGYSFAPDHVPCEHGCA